ncbi:hypothetical protein MSTO_61070 [Mycobacterium stomatepiae]|uniref:Uncharacterized protein n=1 Tax=Mycobacterium stomatepiae TaxID=470076 RepID=A0A7I7QI27_9MYCO|nr:hypothetical protein MSTO_61070 [Mycobacterium stomatepiae]
MRGRFTDALEIVRERHRKPTYRLIEARRNRIGHQHVFRHWDLVFQHPVHEDDVDAGEFDMALYLLRGHLAFVRDELQRQAVELSAARTLAGYVGF